MDKFSNVTSEDLAGIYKEVAETVGIDNAYAIYLYFKGMQMMSPYPDNEELGEIECLFYVGLQSF